MKPQIDQIKEAQAAYVQELTPTTFAVLLCTNNRLDTLWPSDCHLGEKSKELICGQIYSHNRARPAYHFRLTGCGYSKEGEIAHTLRRINPDLPVYELTDGQPRLL